MKLNWFDRHYWKIQLILFVSMVSTCLASTAANLLHLITSHPTPLSSLEITATIFVLFLKLTVMCFGAVLPALFLHMVEASPRTMCHFQPIELIIELVYRWVAQATQIVIRARLWLTGKRPFLSGQYSLANLFSVTAVPYRMYPLSCTLLE